MDLAYDDVRRILIENDPEGLLRMGCPQDEYDSEAGTIYRSLSALHRKPDFQYILELVEYVFYTSFDTIDGSDVCWKNRNILG